MKRSKVTDSARFYTPLQLIRSFTVSHTNITAVYNWIFVYTKKKLLKERVVLKLG